MEDEEENNGEGGGGREGGVTGPDMPKTEKPRKKANLERFISRAVSEMPAPDDKFLADDAKHKERNVGKDGNSVTDSEDDGSELSEDDMAPGGGVGRRGLLPAAGIYHLDEGV